MPAWLLSYKLRLLDYTSSQVSTTYVAGYEVSGLENVPDNGSVLFVYYHGAIPIDVYYFMSRIYLLKNKLIHTVADRFLFKIPGKCSNTNIYL